MACCVPTNCIVKQDGTLVMGAGLARAVARNYPQLPLLWGFKFQKHGPGTYRTTVYDYPTSFVNFISFPTKNHFIAKADIAMIERSVYQLIELMNSEKEIEKVFLPKVGCGLGGLSWGEVRPILANLDERFFIPGDNE